MKRRSEHRPKPQVPERVLQQIRALIGLTISRELANEAIKYAEEHPTEFTAATGLSTRELADLAIEIAQCKTNNRGGN